MADWLAATTPQQATAPGGENFGAIQWVGNDRLWIVQSVARTRVRTLGSFSVPATGALLPVIPNLTLNAQNVVGRPVVGLSVSPDNQSIVLAFADRVTFYLLQGGAYVQSGTVLPPPGTTFTSLAVFANFVALGLSNGSPTGLRVNDWNPQNFQTTPFTFTVNARHVAGQAVTGLQWDPDGDKFATSSEDGSVIIWDWTNTNPPTVTSAVRALS